MSENAERNRNEAPNKAGGHSASRLAPVLVLVLWASCLLVGVLGFAMPYSRPKVICFCDPVIEVQKIEVELKADQTPPLPADPSQPPLPPDTMTPPPIPQPSSPVALAAPTAPAVVAIAPSPAIAFALPVVNPQQLTKVASAASYRAPVPQPAAPTLPAPTKLTLGGGVGREPKWTYPDQALALGHEGVVTVRFVVNEKGRVEFAEAISPCPWPILNDHAVRTIRRGWTFPKGEVRQYIVDIRFDATSKRS